MDQFNCLSNLPAGKWNEIKGRVRRAWSRLTYDEVECVKGDWEELSRQIEKKYGYNKNRARAEIYEFKRSLT